MLKTDTKQLMSESKFFESYSRYIDSKGRYETWEESVARVMDMHRNYYKDKMTFGLLELIQEAQDSYDEQVYLGAQRALQFGGEQLIKHQARIYNCVSTHANRAEFFGEFMYMLLCGAGAGVSVQKHHIAMLPMVRRRSKQAKTFVVPDSIEGWSQAVDVLLSSFFVGGGKHPEYEGRKVYFDLSEIRPKGAPISGGFKAPGHEPLRRCLDQIENLLRNVLKSDIVLEVALKPIEVYDIGMFIADAVISGGIRRAATIFMFSKDDVEMLEAKTGNWFVTNPQRARSNNSIMLLRGSTTFEEFNNLIEYTKKFGEPGIIWTDNLEFTFNPLKLAA